MAEFLGFFRGEILFLVCMEVFFHLPDDVFGFVEVLDVKVYRSFFDLVCVAAGRAELPLLEPIDVSKRRAPWTADNSIHDYVDVRAGLLKIYRKSHYFSFIFYKNFLLSLKSGGYHNVPSVKRNPFIAGNARIGYHGTYSGHGRPRTAADPRR